MPSNVTSGSVQSRLINSHASSNQRTRSGSGYLPAEHLMLGDGPAGAKPELQPPLRDVIHRPGHVRHQGRVTIVFAPTMMPPRIRSVCASSALRSVHDSSQRVVAGRTAWPGREPLTPTT